VDRVHGLGRDEEAVVILMAVSIRLCSAEGVSMGRMIQIDDFIKELQATRAKWGNTCVYIRDVSWGAVALNREVADKAAEQSVEPTRDGLGAFAKSLMPKQSDLPT